MHVYKLDTKVEVRISCKQMPRGLQAGSPQEIANGKWFSSS